MKVYIISKEPFPNGMAATNRIICYAKAIISAGVKCEVLIYTRTESYGRKIKNTIGEGYFEGIPYRYMGKTPIRSKNIFIKQIDDKFDAYRLISFLNNKLQKGDIVLGYLGHYSFFINKVIDVIHKKGAKFVRELCELPYATKKESKRNILLRKKVFLKQFPKCDGFIAISEALCNIANRYKSSKAKIIKIPILVDYKKYDLDDDSINTDIPYIFHSGTLYEQKDGILGMIEAFGIASKKSLSPIRFILTGKKEDSPHFIQLNYLINKYQLNDKIQFTGYLSEHDLRTFLSKASLVIINKYVTEQNKYCFSTKLAEYLAAGKPVIITNVGEAINWLKNNESAYIVEPENTSCLAEKIIQAFTNNNERNNIAKQGKIVCKDNFDYRIYGTKLLAFFQSI